MFSLQNSLACLIYNWDHGASLVILSYIRVYYYKGLLCYNCPIICTKVVWKIALLALMLHEMEKNVSTSLIQ